MPRLSEAQVQDLLSVASASAAYMQMHKSQVISSRCIHCHQHHMSESQNHATHYNHHPHRAPTTHTHHPPTTGPQMHNRKSLRQQQQRS